MSKRLLLVGAGHSHLEVLRQLKATPFRSVDVCMISPSKYQYYSGMFSGFTEGIYSEEETRIDITKLTKDAGVQLIQKKAHTLKALQRKVVCGDGSVYPFDVISFDIGSESLPLSFEDTIARTIKPNHRFIDQMKELRETSQPLIVGGGAAGTELALSMQAYKQQNRIPGQVRLITADRILSETPKWISSKLEKLLLNKGVHVWKDERVEDIHEQYVRTDQGNKVRHTGVLWLGGARGDAIFERSSIDTDQKGFAVVRPTLQFKDYDYIFGAGDCVTLIDFPSLPKSGVYAVRQGPVLWENLNKYLTGGRPMDTYVPQKSALYILSTGGKKGFLIYGPLSSHTHRAWKMKNKIDREFMAEYQ
ncbi:FAD-dependent oxidoreductase [Halobacillus sp. H74]|uniref:FAD-dependent oxidoreductase n=1 Tax=Halobacillus sp. H74 TaxID=3457436 RepID=UPI003FCC55C2